MRTVFSIVGWPLRFITASSQSDWKPKTAIGLGFFGMPSPAEPAPAWQWRQRTGKISFLTGGASPLATKRRWLLARVGELVLGSDLVEPIEWSWYTGHACGCRAVMAPTGSRPASSSAATVASVAPGGGERAPPASGAASSTGGGGGAAASPRARLVEDPLAPLGEGLDTGGLLRLNPLLNLLEPPVRARELALLLRLDPLLVLPPHLALQLAAVHLVEGRRRHGRGCGGLGPARRVGGGRLVLRLGKLLRFDLRCGRQRAGWLNNFKGWVAAQRRGVPASARSATLLSRDQNLRHSFFVQPAAATFQQHRDSDSGSGAGGDGDRGTDLHRHGASLRGAAEVRWRVPSANAASICVR